MRSIPALFLVGRDLGLSFKHIDMISEKSGESGISVCVDTLSYISPIHRNITHYMNCSLMGAGLSALKLRSHVAYCGLLLHVSVSWFSTHDKGMMAVFPFFSSFSSVFCV